MNRRDVRVARRGRERGDEVGRGGVPARVRVEVLADAALLLHPLDQALIERLGHIHPREPQQVGHGDHLGDDGEVLAGIEGHDHLRQLHTQDVHRRAPEARQ